MDVNQIFFKALIQVWWLIPLFLLVTAFRLPVVKGYLGELVVRIAGKIMLHRDVYHPHHNVTLMMEDGTTQIDHLYVSKFGVFVVETKNMKGWIFGTEKQSTWTQQIYKNKYKFQNPLRQNYRHTQAVKEILQVEENAVHSVIAFVRDCQLKSKVPSNVTKGIDCIRYIKEMDVELLSDDDVARINSEIQSKKLASTIKTHREHVASLKKRHQSEDAATECPRCKVELVRRERKKGAQAGTFFWGCSSFPKCRFTREI